MNRKDYIDNTVISTVQVPCMKWYGEYETAISLDNEDTWIIVEGYDNEYEALRGHRSYCNIVSMGNLDQIKSIWEVKEV